MDGENVMVLPRFVLGDPGDEKWEKSSKVSRLEREKVIERMINIS